MSIYDNETISKIFSDLNPTAPQELQPYRLKKLCEIEAYKKKSFEWKEKLLYSSSVEYLQLRSTTIKFLSQQKCYIEILQAMEILLLKALCEEDFGYEL